MIENGFEYHPRLGDAIATTHIDPMLPYGTSEWMLKYGFGVSTLAYNQDSLADGLVGYPPESELKVPDRSDNLNHAYVSTLTSTEQEAYWITLQGVSSAQIDAAFDPDASEAENERRLREAGLLEPGGCKGEAADQVPLPGAELYVSFDQELQDLSARIDADTRLVEYESELSECVRNVGLTFLGFEETTEHLQVELARGMEYLDELQMEELSLAKAVDACGVTLVDWYELREEVAASYRSDFLDSHWSDLRPLVEDQLSSEPG